MKDRTVILVSHHVQLVSPAASYIVALDNGDVTYAGDRAGFIAGGFMEDMDPEDEADQPHVEHNHKDLLDTKATNRHLLLAGESEPPSETASLAESSTVINEEEKETSPPPERKTPRKLVEEERRATGRIGWLVWKSYFQNQGGLAYWLCFVLAVLVGATPPVWENGWLSRWSSSYSNPRDHHSAIYYVAGYAILTLVGVLATTLRFVVLYHGSIRASTRVHKRMLERILFATIRFHDTSVRGRTLVSLCSDPPRSRTDHLLLSNTEPIRQGLGGSRQLNGRQLRQDCLLSLEYRRHVLLHRIRRRKIFCFVRSLLVHRLLPSRQDLQRGQPRYATAG